MSDKLLSSGDDATLPQIIYAPNEKLPPPPSEPSLTLPEALHDLINALNNGMVDVVIALEPYFKVLQDLTPYLEAANTIIEQEKQAQRQRSKQDRKRQQHIARGGKWKAF